MDAYAAIVAKRDTRSYTDEPVAEEVLDRVLRAGRMAGSAKNLQLVRIVVVTDPATLTALTECGDFTSWIDQAPVVLVLTCPVEDGRLFDVGRMAQNVMICATAEGLASCPVTFQHQDRVRAVLGVPADVEAPHAVTLGHPGPPPADRPARAPRIALDELVYRERW